MYLIPGNPIDLSPLRLQGSPAVVHEIRRFLHSGLLQICKRTANADSRVPSPLRERARVRVKNSELLYSIYSVSLMNRYPITLTLSPKGRGKWFLKPLICNSLIRRNDSVSGHISRPHDWLQSKMQGLTRLCHCERDKRLG
jgi:hypothetical protein